ncbi:MAG: DNA-processing protein DprA [Clostridiales bacterium]|nr:DNA-processing protein DprA [Candidatus Cacconaster stercorequi]
MSALKYWIWLATLPGLQNRSKLLLLEHFSSPEAIYYAEPEEYRLVQELKSQQAALLQEKSLARAEKILEDCAKKELFIVTQADAAYPARLRNIFEPPILLYGRGKMPLFDEEAAIAMVGTRKCTPYGKRAAEQLGYELASQGALVVSGMARGIDSAAHRGALRAGGFAAAVLGGGVDVIYPPDNRRLYEDIAASGVLLSEYPPGTEPLRHHFPARNRIISGLCLATVVVEAPEKSGALITAATALDQGREIFAVPGPIDAPSSRGCNQLIRDGAGLVGESWDILGEYQSRYPHKLKNREVIVPPLPEDSKAAKEPVTPAAAVPSLPVLDLKRNREGLTDDQICIVKILTTDQPLLIDEVAEITGIPMRRVLSALTVMEIDGFARQEGAGCFVRTVAIRENQKR